MSDFPWETRRPSVRPRGATDLPNAVWSGLAGAAAATFEAADMRGHILVRDTTDRAGVVLSISPDRAPLHGHAHVVPATARSVARRHRNGAARRPGMNLSE